MSAEGRRPNGGRIEAAKIDHGGGHTQENIIL